MTDAVKSKVDEKMDKFVIWYKSNLKLFYASIYLGIILFFIALFSEVKFIEYTSMKLLIIIISSIVSFHFIKIYIEINNKVLVRGNKYFEIWIIPYLGFMYYLLTLTRPEIYNYLLSLTHVESSSFSSIVNEMSFVLAIQTLLVFFILPLLVYLPLDSFISLYIHNTDKTKTSFINILSKTILWIIIINFISANNLISSKDTIFNRSYDSWFVHLGFQNNSICDGKIINNLKTHKLSDDKYILSVHKNDSYEFEVKSCSELTTLSNNKKSKTEEKIITQELRGDEVSGIEIILQKEIVDSLVYALKQENHWYEATWFISSITAALTLAAATITNKINSNGNYNLKQLESQLKIQESVLGIKLEALKSLTSITRELTPTIWPDPSFDSTEAYTEVFSGMDGLRKKLDGYLNSFNYILSDEVIKEVENVLYICNINQDNGANSGQDYKITKNEEKAAKNVLESLNNAAVIFKKELKISIT
jgi:hypothetical protein